MKVGIKRFFTELDNGLVEVKVVPPEWAYVGEGATINLTRDQFDRMLTWLNGKAMIQEALPDLSPRDREILTTGIGPEKWDELFGEWED